MQVNSKCSQQFRVNPQTEMSEGKYLRLGTGKDFSDMASKAPSMREGGKSDGTFSNFENFCFVRGIQ